MINFKGGLINADGVYINPDKVNTFTQAGNSFNFKTEVALDNGQKMNLPKITSHEFATAFVKAQKSDEFNEHRIINLTA